LTDIGSLPNAACAACAYSRTANSEELFPFPMLLSGAQFKHFLGLVVVLLIVPAELATVNHFFVDRR
jgi:hypothetical protein